MAASAVLPELTSPKRVARQRPRRGLALLLLASLLILSLGAVEDLYGDTDRGDIYGTDGVQNLDIARAFQQHDFHTALNPFWSQGYPALLAVARPLFPAGPIGDWRDTRTVNFAIYAADYLAFLFLVTGLFRNRWEQIHSRDHTFLLWFAALAIFLVSQTCVGQVSRVNPDELVNTMFFVAAGLLARIFSPSASKLVKLGGLLGLSLGVGFLAKSIFLVLGCGIIVLFALALLTGRRSVKPAIAAAAVFAIVVGGYGSALSCANGHFTLGESGSLNYAWHVNRLQKWVHWQGGFLPAAEAWPKASIARFAQWEKSPPVFGTPIHPSVILQTSPVVYGIAAPVHATYAPYFDEPYFYAGYHQVFRWRYQFIAVVKNSLGFALIVLSQPFFFTITLAIAALLFLSRSKRTFLRILRNNWLLPAVAFCGIAIYLCVHIEGRYIASFFAVLMLSLLFTALEVRPSRLRVRAAALLLVLGFTASIVRYQLPVWRNLEHHKSPTTNIEWLRGQAMLNQNLPFGTDIGVIHWTPNLQSDWAFIAHLQITSEIASPRDMDLFWQSSTQQQQITLDTFHRAGAVAVIAINKPPSAGDPEWQHLPNTDLWIHRF